MQLYLIILPSLGQLLQLLREEGACHILDHGHALPAFPVGLTLPAQEAVEKTVVCLYDVTIHLYLHKMRIVENFSEQRNPHPMLVLLLLLNV